MVLGSCMQKALTVENAKLEDDKAVLLKEVLASSNKHAQESKQQARDFEKKMNDFVEKADKVRFLTSSAHLSCVVRDELASWL